VAGARPNTGSDPFFDRGWSRGVVEEGDMLLPRQADQHTQPVAIGNIEQPARRYGVGTEGIEAVGGHASQVPCDAVAVTELSACLIGSKRTVGHGAQVELRVAQEEKLAAHLRPHRRQRRHGVAAGAVGDI
jgi:hypothetical protein